jgi:hypothetical protein
MHLFYLMLTTSILILSGCKSSEKANSLVNDNETAKTNDSLMLPVGSEFTPIAPGPVSEISPTSIFEPGYIGKLPGSGSGGQNRISRYVHFVPNSYVLWTSENYATTHLIEGCTGSNCECIPGEENCEALPAFANILLEPSNFIWCKGGPYALCYYSGPDDGSTDLSCTLSKDRRFANCKCFEIPWGTYFVDINAILNYAIYQKTIQVCGADGSGCSGSANINKAPVCEAINKNNFIPGADLISTFSLDCVPTDGLGQTNCTPALYAGCMTSPCQRTASKGIVECSCPTFDGPFQVGTTLPNPEQQCSLGDNLVWSAAFSPSVSTLPPLTPCIPDAPGANGCPLYDPNTMSLPVGIDCQAVCETYACMNDAGIEPAFTCDATLCTGECNERHLLETACEGLAACAGPGLAAVIKLESEVECSCCASQLCGCEPNAETNNAIFELNQKQRELNIVPQCDVNATLCGIDNPS